MPEPAVDCILDMGAELSECPVWCGRSQSLYWVDIPKGTLNRFDPATGRNDSWEMGEPIGSFALCETAGDVLVALKSGIYRQTLATGHREGIAAPETHLPDNRMNDGRTDPAGRFWVGSMRDPQDGTKKGTLYRLAPIVGMMHGSAWECMGAVKAAQHLANPRLSWHIVVHEETWLAASACCLAAA